MNFKILQNDKSNGAKSLTPLNSTPRNFSIVDDQRKLMPLRTPNVNEYESEL
jgi:hypothetical protein